MYFCKNDWKCSMKKIISIVFLLLANFIVLAHAAIPHHHHNRIVFSIFNFLSISEELEHDHHDYAPSYTHQNSDKHSHQGEYNEYCLLNGIYLNASQDKQHFLSSDCTDLFKQIDYFSLFAATSTNDIELKDYGCLSFRQKPYVNPYQSHYNPHCLGLRAPPFC